MTTGNDLVSGALRVITSVTPGEPVDGQEAANALVVLNRMLKAWSANSLMLPFRTLENFPLVLGQSSYTIGPGANFNTVRPDYVTAAWRRDANGMDFPIEVIPKELYNPIRLKSLTGLPSQLYYDAQYPSGVIYLYATEMQLDTLYLESLKPVAQFTTLQTVMNLPGEYEEAIVYLLAQRLAPEYGFSIASNPDIAELVRQAGTFIKRKNTKIKPAGFDPALQRPQPFNIYNG
jgi:hypothetical protein